MKRKLSNELVESRIEGTVNDNEIIFTALLERDES